MEQVSLDSLTSYLIQKNKDKSYLTLDIETRFGNIENPYKGKAKKILDLDKLNPWEHEILLFQIGDINTQYIVDCRSTDLTSVTDILKTLDNLTIVGHNLKYDIKWLNVKYDYIPNKMFDTMIVEKCLTLGKYDLIWDTRKKAFTSNKAYSLNAVSKRILGFDYDNTQLNLFEPRASKKVRDSFPGIKDEPITEVQLTYAKYDVIIPSKLYLHYTKSKLPKVVDLENTYLKVIVTMESEGIYLDNDLWLENYFTNESKIYNILEKLNTYGTINWNSSKQKLTLLETLGIEPKDKHGKLTTGKEVLSRIDHDVTRLLTEMSVYQKLSSSFGLNTLELVNNKSTKLHTSFNQMVSNSRLSSNKPK